MPKRLAAALLAALTAFSLGACQVNEDDEDVDDPVIVENEDEEDVDEGEDVNVDVEEEETTVVETPEEEET